MVDHDRLFKQLLSTFFIEFLDLFAPALAREIEADSVEFLEKETFTDAVAGDHHIVDLLARVRVRGAPGCVLVHVENKADANGAREFPRRMFRYFAGLEARHPGTPIYPVAVLSYERPRRRYPDRYTMNLPGLDVLRFRFRQVQLNRLPWREYVHWHSPVAAALMSRMCIEPEDRWRVKLECVRLLVKLQLDRGKMRLIATFVDAYLKLDAGESRLFDEELRAMPAGEKEDVMEFTTQWKEEGRAEGLREGHREGHREGVAGVVMRQLRRRLGGLSETVAATVAGLPIEALELLADDLLEFTELSDLERWLGARR
jgi:hypothetical protein